MTRSVAWNKGYTEDPLPPRSPLPTQNTFTCTAYLNPCQLFEDTSNTHPTHSPTRTPSIKTIRSTQALRPPLSSHSSYASTVEDSFNLPSEGSGVMILGPSTVEFRPAIEEI